MAGIISSGVGSGIDINNLVSQLVQAEGAPQLNRLNISEAKLQSQLSAVGTLKGSLSDFQSSLTGLVNLSSFQSLTATSGDTTAYTATASADAGSGTHSVKVLNTADAHKLASKAFADTTAAMGTGSITFQFGTYDSGGNTFTANANKSSSTITIDSSNNSLEGIRSAVNNAKLGVSASIINDGTGNRLVFTSEASGAANSLKISVSGDSDSNDSDDAGLSQLAYDPTGALGTGKNMTQTIAAKDASLTVDGLAITSATNTVNGAIPGVTINLLASSTGEASTLSVSRNTAKITSSIENFVSKYNAFSNTVKNLASYDAETKKGGILLGDATLRNVNNRIRSTLGNIMSGLGGQYDSLVAIGVSAQKDGSLSLDSTKLAAALSNAPDAVGKIFSAAGDTTDALVTYKRSTDYTKDGNYAINITQAATQGLYSGGVATSPTLTIDGNNNTFSLNVNGVQSGSISLTQKTYTSNADLAVEMQSRINGDSTLKAKGVSVSVSYDTDHFVFTSSAYGAGSKVNITAVNTNTTADLGLAVGGGSVGKDVEGTIGGKAAAGFGRLLTGTEGDSVGLQVEVRGTATGGRGNVSFNRGIAHQLNTLIGGFLDASTGSISNRTNELNSSIRNITTQRTTVNERLAVVEKRYLTQFNAMDAIVASLKETGSYLTQQFFSNSNSN